MTSSAIDTDYTEPYSYDDASTSSATGPSMTEDLKGHMYTIMKDKGLLDSMKSQIRQKLIAELSTRKSLRPSQSQEVKKEVDIIDKAVNSLIADFLHRSQYNYTLSVFVPETGLSSDKIYNTKELLSLLQIPQNSQLYNKLFTLVRKSGKSFLWSFLKVLCEGYGQEKKEVIVQTGNELVSLIPLSEKLQRIDKQFDERRAEVDLRDRAKFEEKLLAYQRDTDRRMKEELHNEILRFKETTLVKMRLEERERLEVEFDAKRKELEYEYRNKMSNVLARERQNFEQMTRLQETNERESYMRRQTMLEEIDKIRERENEMRRQEEQWDRERRLLHEKYQTKSDELAQKERDLKTQELLMNEKMRKEIEKIKTMEEEKYMQRWKDLQTMESRLREEQRIQDEQKASTSKLREEVLKRQQLFDEMEVVQYPLVKEENLTLKKELELVKERLGELRNDYEEEKIKYEHILKEKSAPTLEEKMLRKDLETTKDNLHQEQQLWEEQKRNLQKRLQDEVDNSKSLLRRYEEQNEQVRDLQRELNEVRSILTGGDVVGKFQSASTGNRSARTPRSSRRFFYPINNNRRDDVPPPIIVDNMAMSFDPHPRLRDHEMDANDDGGSSVEWEDMVRESKHRLQGLEEETAFLQTTYQEFQMRQLHPEPRQEDKEKSNIAVHVHYEPTNSRQFRMPPNVKLPSTNEWVGTNNNITMPNIPLDQSSSLPQRPGALPPGWSSGMTMTQSTGEIPFNTFQETAPEIMPTSSSVVAKNKSKSLSQGDKSSHDGVGPSSYGKGPDAYDNKHQSTVVTFDIPQDSKPVMVPYVDRSSAYPASILHESNPLSRQEGHSKRGFTEPPTDPGATSRDIGSTGQQLGPQDSQGYDADDYINPDDTTPGGALSTSEDVVMDASGQGPPLPHDQDTHYDQSSSEEESDNVHIITNNSDKDKKTEENDEDIDPVMLKYMQRVKAERAEKERLAQEQLAQSSQEKRQRGRQQHRSDRSDSSSSSEKRISMTSKGDEQPSSSEKSQNSDNFW